MIVDATLCYMETSTAKQQYMMLMALTRLPIDAIEMTVVVYNNIVRMKLPRQKYILRVKNKYDIENYPGFHYYVKSINIDKDSDKKWIEQVMYDTSGRAAARRIIVIDEVSVINMCEQFCTWIRNGKLYLEPLNYIEQATALAYTWLKCGGNSVITAFCGLGNHAPLEEVLMTLHVTGIKRLIKPLNFSELKKAAGNIAISPVKPVVGAEIFAVESGIHVDGIKKNPQLYEPYPPELVNASRRIVLGDMSGKSSIEAKLKEYNLVCGKIDTVKILEIVKQKSHDLHRAITDEEFCNLVKMIGCAGSAEKKISYSRYNTA
ncbi:hypothetical protein [Pectinatus frisingensis]|uniref:homocitrate synthase/isopropylmalate synthase family protein n=1 Tax=Pectinatus frisingensis TaxID=865 RepID=UPI0018C4E6DE|nr:hypothetical protein [Pectinatus frisingensis]